MTNLEEFVKESLAQVFRAVQGMSEEATARALRTMILVGIYTGVRLLSEGLTLRWPTSTSPAAC